MTDESGAISRDLQPGHGSTGIGSLPLGRWLLNAVVGLILLFLMLPTLIVIPVSFSASDFIEFPPKALSLRWYSEYFNDPEWLKATWFSFKLAFCSTIVATTIGTMAAIALSRSDFVGKQAVQAVAMMPLIVPHVVLAVAFYLIFAPLGLTGNLLGFTIANAILSVPYVVITVTAALQRVDPDLELAALSCGASRTAAFFHVVLPNAASGVMSGAIFAFLTALDEATVAFFLSGVENQTITKKLFQDIDFNLTPVIAAASTILIAVSLLLMAVVERIRLRQLKT